MAPANGRNVFGEDAKNDTRRRVSFLRAAFPLQKSADKKPVTFSQISLRINATSTIAQELDQQLQKLDPETARQVERLLREVLANAT